MSRPNTLLDLPVHVVRAAMRVETSRTLATRWGVHISTVTRWRGRLGLTRRARQFRAPRRAQVVAVLAQHPAGLRLSVLAQTQGITTQALATVLWHAGRAGIIEKQDGRWRLVAP